MYQIHGIMGALGLNEATVMSEFPCFLHRKEDIGRIYKSITFFIPNFLQESQEGVYSSLLGLPTSKWGMFSQNYN